MTPTTTCRPWGPNPAARCVGLVVVVLSLALGACSKGHDQAVASTTPPDPCRLFTQAEVATYANLPPGAVAAWTPWEGSDFGRPFLNMDGIRLCKLQADNVPRIFVGTLVTFPKESFKRFVEGKTKDPIVRVKDLGDEAVWSGDELAVRDNDLVVGVWVHTPDVENRMDRATMLAKEALRRLRKPSTATGQVAPAGRP